ncbi:MAG TPA: TMEM175 family protein [Thermoplasmata archaeon]
MLDDEGSRHHRPVREGSSDEGGPDLSRILALSDGIFAFAMTLLALSLVVPTYTTAPGDPSGWLANQLWEERGAFGTYAIGFLLLGIWWSAHTRLFTHMRRWDRPLQWFNLLFLLTIAVAPFFTRLLLTYPDVRTASIVYSAFQMFTGLVLAGIWFYASAGRRLLWPTVTDLTIRTWRVRALLGPAVFALAIGLAFIDPLYSLYSYLLLFPLQWLTGRRLQRVARALESAG